MRVRKLYNDGGEIASTILQQLGGANRLHAMTGAYNFVNLGNGLSFKIKNQRANYIKITLTSMDLYDVEVGRIRGNTYKIVSEGKGMYAEELKPFIEKSTGMYLTLGIGFANGGMISVKSDDGEDLRFKIDTDEMSIEVDETTKKYLSDIALIADRQFRKLKDTYIFWYDDLSDSDITELEEVFQTSLNKYADGGELEDDTFVMLFKGYGFVEKRGSYGTRTFYNIQHNAKIYYDPKYRSISGYVGGGEGNDEVIPYSVDGVLDFLIEHDITESEATPMAKGGKIKEEEYKKLYTRLKQKKEKGEILDKREEYALNKSEYILKTRGKMAHGGKVELIFHGSSREIPMGEFDSTADAKRYVESSDWQRPYSIRKINKTPKVVRTQFEEEVFEYAKGGEFKPYGKTKGRYKIEYVQDGEKQSEVWESKEMVEDRGKKLLKLGCTDIKITEVKKMAKGGEPKPSLIPDYKKISNVEVEDIDRDDYPDFSDAYISYAEYDGEPMTDEQLEELNQDGLFVYDAIHMRLFENGGKVRQNKKDKLWESIKNKFSEIFYLKETDSNEIFSNDVTAEKNEYLYFASAWVTTTLSFEEAENKFKRMLTEDEKKMIKIERNVKDINEAFGVMSEKKILVKRIDKMADGGNVWDEDLNVYTLVSSKEYFGSDTASDKRRWFRRNGRGLTRDQAKRMAEGYIDRYGKERVYIGNIRHYR